MRPVNPSPLVSVILPCFNAEATLERAVRSCLEQTHRPLEILIVDDGSQDSSPLLARDLAQRHPEIGFLRQPQSGAGAARQKGIEAAGGRYIQWLDSDDLLEPGKIQPQVEYLEQHPKVDGVYGDWKDRWFDEEGKSIDYLRSFPLQNCLAELVGGKWIALHAYLLRREAALRVRWDPSLTALEDADYWIQLAIQGVRFEYLKTPDCAVYCAALGDNRRNRLDRTWLKARLLLHQKTEQSLLRQGLLEQPSMSSAMAMGYVGLAWRCLQAGNRPIFEKAVKKALALTSEDEICRRDWIFRLYPSIGLRRSLLLQSLWQGSRRRAKRLLYSALGFNPQKTLSQNLEQLTGS